MILRYDMWTDDPRHPVEVMKALGITYTRAEPQPIADQWLFFGCQNVPETLPKHIDKIK